MVVVELCCVLEEMGEQEMADLGWLLVLGYVEERVERPSYGCFYCHDFWGFISVLSTFWVFL